MFWFLFNLIRRTHFLCATFLFVMLSFIFPYVDGSFYQSVYLYLTLKHSEFGSRRFLQCIFSRLHVFSNFLLKIKFRNYFQTIYLAQYGLWLKMAQLLCLEEMFTPFPSQILPKLSGFRFHLNTMLCMMGWYSFLLCSLMPNLK